MPRDDDRKRGGRPPGGGPSRGGPPRGKRFAGGDKRDGDGPRPPRKVGGRAFRKAHGDVPRGEGRDERAGGKRFGRDKPGERSFGDKRRYGSKPGGGFRKDGDRPRRAFDRSDGGPRGERGDRPKFDRPKFDRPREDRPARSAEGDHGPRRFDRPKFDRPRGDRPYDKRPRDNERTGDRPRFSRDRGERAANDRPRDERRRNDRVARSNHAWRDHPRSEAASPPPDRRDDAPREGPRREFQQRPAFGGRGAYRERKPFSSRDTRDRREARRHCRKNPVSASPS